MSKKYKLISLIFGLGVVIGVVILYLTSVDAAIFNPAGQISSLEKQLIIFTLLLSLIVVVPVFGLATGIAYKYRESNKKARYMPDWAGNRKLETIWWTLPLALILVLSVVTWKSAHELDPYKQLSSAKKPLTVQVVALNWKWLFIYPDQNIASLNYLSIPTNTPINFQITSDATMNAMWIPRLGGQMYAMPGMSTQLHLSADQPGNYHGLSSNISGRGFSGMKFIVHASSDVGFEQWIEKVRSSSNPLNLVAYKQLKRPSINNKTTYYSTSSANLYHNIRMQYMTPTYSDSGQLNATDSMSEMDNMSGISQMHHQDYIQ